MPLQVLRSYQAHARCAIQTERDHRVISEGERLQRLSIRVHAGSGATLERLTRPRLQ